MEVEKYREDSDSLLSFLKECCDKGIDYEVGSTELYNAYKNYCEESNLRPYAHRTMISNLKASDTSITTGRDSVRSKRILKGLKLKDDFEI